MSQPMLTYQRFNTRAGGAILIIVMAAAVIGQMYTPYDPIAIDLSNTLAAPTTDHWLGTDQFGRDTFSRMLAAASVSISVSFLAVTLAAILGLLIGSISGYVGGPLDSGVMIIVDALLAIPSILLALAVMVVLGPNKFSMIVALGIAYTPNVVRVIRGVVFSIRAQEFVEAAAVMGSSGMKTILRHIIPNCITPLTVLFSAIFAYALLAESALSFLGLGVPPPYPTWGGMLSDARLYVTSTPWLSIFPGLAISLTLFGINVIGDALRDKFDPKT